MKKNTILILFISVFIGLLFSCTSPTATATTVETENPVTETPTEVVSAKSIFDELVNEFVTCPKLDKVLQGETCGAFQEFTGEDGKAKLESLAYRIFILTGRMPSMKNFGTSELLEPLLSYDDTAEEYAIHTINKAYWQDLVLLSFVQTSASPMENSSSLLLIFTKSGEFKDALLINRSYSAGSQVSNAKYVEKVEKTEQSLKLVIGEAEQSEDEDVTEKTIGFYLINKDGTVTYTNN